MRRLTRAAAVAAYVAAIAVGLTTVSTATRAAVTEANFRLDTFEDLVALCGVQPGDPMADGAIHMCHGYMVGLHHFHVLMGQALEGDLFCMEGAAPPTRNEFVAMMVDWSRSHPEQYSKEAIDGVLGWAADAYPCSE